MTLGNSRRGINEWELGADFPCAHGWKIVLSFCTDISERLLKIRGEGAQAVKSSQILLEMAELSPRDSTLGVFSSSEEDQEVT